MLAKCLGYDLLYEEFLRIFKAKTHTHTHTHKNTHLWKKKL